jgi:hypothetical protein
VIRIIIEVEGAGATLQTVPPPDATSQVSPAARDASRGQGPGVVDGPPAAVLAAAAALGAMNAGRAPRGPGDTSASPQPKPARFYGNADGGDGEALAAGMAPDLG